MDVTVVAVFVVVYIAMAAGGLPGLALDRTGAALLGAIALMVMGDVATEDLQAAVHVPTLALLLGLMVVSAQFRLSGFYSWLVRGMSGLPVSPPILLGWVMGAAGGLSALLANDIICLAMTPVLIELCTKRGLRPLPFLLGLALASNIGSATTLIGNPQNMLIGQVLEVDFGDYLASAFLPVMLSLGVAWLYLSWWFRGEWGGTMGKMEVQAPAFDHWQTVKGLVVLAGVVGAFLFSRLPHEVVALAAAGFLLCSRRMHTRSMLGLVDWPLLLLFTGLFVVNHAMQTSGNLDRLFAVAAEAGVNASDPGWLFVLSTVLSNLVSNVPAVMLLLPVASHEQAALILALSSTLAGNLLLVGSIANLIVAEQASVYGVRFGWIDHAKVGLPVGSLTLGICAAWLLMS
ncbi:MAG TPA: anion transporter [Kiritimatiellia bacterium]|nr:anion transporter [Kiritimatiellia bacterium]